jgi:hypothetical protein
LRDAKCNAAGAAHGHAWSFWKSQGTRKKCEKAHKSKESRELKVEQSYGRGRIRTTSKNSNLLKKHDKARRDFQRAQFYSRKDDSKIIALSLVLQEQPAW